MAAHAGWWRLLGMAAVSVSATYLALYELGFRGQSGRASLRVRHRVGEAFLVYVLCLAVAAVLLAGYGQFQGQPIDLWMQEIVVLGFPAAMGGAAAQVVL